MHHSSVPAPEPSRSVQQAFFDVELRSDGIVWLKRNQTPYDSLAAVHKAYDDFFVLADEWAAARSPRSETLRGSAPPGIGWLYDLRFAGAQRNDPEFEAVIRARRPDLLHRSPLLVVLVKTAIGRLQIHRLAGANRGQMQISDDLEASLAWLRRELGGDAPSVRGSRTAG